MIKCLPYLNVFHLHYLNIFHLHYLNVFHLHYLNVFHLHYLNVFHLHYLNVFHLHSVAFRCRPLSTKLSDMSLAAFVDFCTIAAFEDICTMYHQHYHEKYISLSHHSIWYHLNIATRLSLSDISHVLFLTSSLSD